MAAREQLAGLVRCVALWGSRHNSKDKQPPTTSHGAHCRSLAVLGSHITYQPFLWAQFCPLLHP